MSMKKVLSAIGLALSVSGVFAQASSTSSTSTAPSTPELTSKKGEVILPQAGDWAVAMDATPWFSYIGNLFHGTGTTQSPTASFLNANQTILGKYYVNSRTAYRFLVRIGVNSNNQSHEIPSSDSGQSFPTPQVEDQRSITSHFVGLGFGIEKRRGNTRVQGYYGAEVMFYIAGSDTSFTYGNAYNSSSNSSPYWWDWNSGTNGSLITTGLPRNTQDGPGGTFGISLLAFGGVEYFFAPKISIGAEFTWGINFQTTSQGSRSTEEINTVSGNDQTDIYKTNGSSSFSLDNGLNQAWGNSSGALYLTFHF